MTSIAILLLAAGASSRMKGRDKLMEEVDGQPLLTLMCRRAALTGLPVYVTLPGPSHPRAAATGDAIQVPVPDAAEGMSASIRRGTAALPDDTQAVMILPADMPEINGAGHAAPRSAFRRSGQPRPARHCGGRNTRPPGAVSAALF